MRPSDEKSIINHHICRRKNLSELMKKLLFLVLFALSLHAFSQNLQLRANKSYGSTVLANIGGYVDTVGNEYALVGTYNGLDIVDVSNSSSPVSRFMVPGAGSDWREVKTYRKYAYVVTEGGGGLTIIDMSHLPDTVYYKQYVGDGAISGQLNSIHALHCDTAMGFLYLYGSNINNGNSLFFSLTDPWNPHYVGEYVFPGDAYVHDGLVLNDTMYEGHINSGFFTVVDVRNKLNPILLATQSTPNTFTHNTWLSDDHRTLFTTDETSYSYLTAYDITDLANITELSRFQTAAGTGAAVHNTQILNDYSITSWYREGVVIVDEARPRNPIEVAHYDTYPQGSGAGYDGCWGVYPYLPSGTIVASDINNGLFVFTPTYIRGCYLEGDVRDSLTNALINNATIEILTTTITKSTDASGEFRTGLAIAGLYDVRISKPGYATKTLTSVQLSNGVLTFLNVLLAPLQTYSFSGIVNDSLTGLPIEGAQVILEGSGLNYLSTTSPGGIFSFPAVISESYLMSSGKWGYRTVCDSVTLVQGMSLSATLSPGYYDDFSLDNGWIVTGSSANRWERGIPVGTYDGNNTEINPASDITGDCGAKCFVTDNGGSPYNNHDVDNGNTILTSPVFDATIYNNPIISYYYRYLCINGVGTPNDTMKISLTNGTNTVIIQAIDPNNPSNGTWVYSSFPIQSLITPTATMRFSVEVSDNAPGNIVEGALDQFEVTGQLTLNMNEPSRESSAFTVYPNPFTNEFTINISQINNPSAILTVKEAIGKTVFTGNAAATENVRLGKDWSSGIYTITLQSLGSITTKKVVKR